MLGLLALYLGGASRVPYLDLYKYGMGRVAGIPQRRVWRCKKNLLVRLDVLLHKYGIHRTTLCACAFLNFLLPLSLPPSFLVAWRALTGL